MGRERYHATSDDTVVEGGVACVASSAVLRISSGTADDWLWWGGRGSNHYGCRRAVRYFSQDLVRLWRSCERTDGDGEAMAPLALQLGAWRPPPYYHEQSLQARRIRGTCVVVQASSSPTSGPPRTTALTSAPGPGREQLTFRSLRIVICSVLPLLPLIAGLPLRRWAWKPESASLCYLRPAPILWLLGLLFRRAADSIALSLAALRSGSAISRSGRRTRRAAPSPEYLLKCFGVALCRLVAFIYCLAKGGAMAVPGRCVMRRPDEVKGGWRGAFETCKYGDCRGGARRVSSRRVLCSSARRLFMLIPGRRKRQGAPHRRGRREVVRHDGLVPGSAAPLLYAAAGWWQGARDLLARGRRATRLGAWAAFTAFVKFAFVVFALNRWRRTGTPTRRAGSSGRCVPVLLVDVVYAVGMGGNGEVAVICAPVAAWATAVSSVKNHPRSRFHDNAATRASATVRRARTSGVMRPRVNRRCASFRRPGPCDSARFPRTSLKQQPAASTPIRRAHRPPPRAQIQAAASLAGRAASKMDSDGHSDDELSGVAATREIYATFGYPRRSRCAVPAARLRRGWGRDGPLRHPCASSVELL